MITSYERYIYLIFFSVISSIYYLISLTTLITLFFLIIKKNCNSVYILSFFHILADFAELNLYIGFKFPSVLAKHSILKGNPTDHTQILLSGTYYLFSWFVSGSHACMAVNRLVVIRYNTTKWFTIKNTILFVIIWFIIVLSFVIFTHYLVPCCWIIFSEETYMLQMYNPNKLFNYANYVISIPLNAISSIICLSCYLSLFIIVRNSSIRVRSDRSIRKKDIRLAIQLGTVSSCFSAKWILYRITGASHSSILSKNTFLWVFLYTFISLTNNVITSILYLFFNFEVQNMGKRIILSFKGKFTKKTIANAI